MQVFKELNNNQLQGLANLCFDLSKGSLLLALFPASEAFDNLGMVLLKTIMALLLGLVFTYMALVLLKTKRSI